MKKRLWQSASESALYSKGKEKNRRKAKAKEKTLPLDLFEELYKYFDLKEEALLRGRSTADT